ncbi:uncharacterized protein LOC143027705 [Oratosquilla oratoria]|uniref:uncharacterized protein LOC143027705 n=1 Tax=Oratosquilla oratoria TaxID=337810 RepID=UPI003F76AA10
MVSWTAVVRVLVTLAVIGYTNAQRGRGKPSIVTESQTFNIRAGDSVTLPCEVNNMGRRSLFWFKGEDRRNRELLLQVKYVQGRPSVPASFVSKYLNTGKYALDGTGLNLPIVEPIDAGEYTCSVSWVRQSIKHTLNVYEDDYTDGDTYDDYGYMYNSEDETNPWSKEDEEEEEVESEDDTDFRGRYDHRWRQEDFGIDTFPESREVVVSEGSNVTLTCRVRGYQNDPIWLHLGNQVAEGSVLQLAQVHRSQAGEYMCQVQNQHFQNNSTFQVHILYLEVNAEVSTVEAASFGPAELACVISGSHPVQVEWFHNGEFVQPDNVTLRLHSEGQRFLLQIAEVNEQNVGRYECRAYSDSGRSMAQMDLVPLPSGMMSFDFKSIPSQVPGKLTIQFSLEFDSVDMIQSVEIYYTKAESEHGWERSTLGQDNVFKITERSYRAEQMIDLDPDSEYYIQAKPFTVTGRSGPYEAPRTFHTPVEEVIVSEAPQIHYAEYDYQPQQKEEKSTPNWLKKTLIITSRLPILYRVFGNRLAP